MGHHTTPTTSMPTWSAQLLTGFAALLQRGGKQRGATCPPNSPGTMRAMAWAPTPVAHPLEH